MNPYLKFVCTHCGLRDEPCKHWMENHLVRLLDKIIRLLERQTGFTIQQVQGGRAMPINGIVAGSSGVFQATPLPAGSTIPAGSIPQWSTSDTTNTTLTPSADGLQVTVAVAAGATIGNFTLTVQNQDGTFPTSVTVPVTVPVIPQTGFQIDQIS